MKEKPKYSYISVITSNDYLPGLIVLNKTLLDTKPKYKFLLLVTKDISKETLDKIKKLNINYLVIEDDIKNPTDITAEHRWFPTYSKLHVFNQTQFDKVVYLDIDMMILENIDELFDHPHMSCTNSPSLLSRKSDWTHLNSGIFVIEPSASLFKDMVSKIGSIEILESGGTFERPKTGSDQDFLNAYYPDWPQEERLHLDHKYNIFHYYLDEYNKECGYGFDKEDKPIKVIHYASYLKPWMLDEKQLRELENDKNRRLEFKSVMDWLNIYKKYD